MSTKSRAKRAARQHKHSHKWDANPSGGYGLLQQRQFAMQVAPLQMESERRFAVSVSGWAALTAVTGDSAATIEHWAQLATVANLALMLAELGYGPEHEPVFVRAQEAVTRMYARGIQKKVWRLDGPGLQDMRDALTLHDLQCEHATYGDICQAMAMIRDRILSGDVFQIQFSEAA